LRLEEGEEDVDSSFTIAPGGSHYHAIIGLYEAGVGSEMQIAELLSRECAEPVYSVLDIFEAEAPPLVQSYQNGKRETLEVDPHELAEHLGCPFPEVEDPPKTESPLRTAALVEGVHSQEALRVLEEEAGYPLPPGRFRFMDTPRGLLITGGEGELGFADITLAERFPLSTVYSVTATPGLDIFFARVWRGEETLANFTLPPEYQKTPEHAVTEIKGERTPERILAALGIPAEWFRS
jgi:hypothetical protein